tara:strand:+ start:1620 stop:1868 length:249 start_codon:yes stop_codon:yes gene_type:complete
LRIKVLIVSQYFYPENFRINDIAKYLKNKKYEVDILTSHPDYPNKDTFKKYYQKKKNIQNFKIVEFIEFQQLKENLEVLLIY